LGYGDLERIVCGLDNSMNDYEQSANDYEQTLSTPKPLKLNIEGISTSSALAFLFSPKVDEMVNAIVDIFMSGNYNGTLEKVKVLTAMFERMGIGKGVFNGPVGTTIINTIENTTKKFKSMKSTNKLKNLLTALKNKNALFKNLKDAGTKLLDPELRRKYEEAVLALESLCKMLIGIYQNRKYINDKVIKGLHNIMTEEEDNDIIIINKIEC